LPAEKHRARKRANGNSRYRRAAAQGVWTLYIMLKAYLNEI